MAIALGTVIARNDEWLYEYIQGQLTEKIIELGIDTTFYNPFINESDGTIDIYIPLLGAIFNPGDIMTMIVRSITIIIITPTSEN